MSDDNLKPSDRLYYAIAALPGWDEVSEQARNLGESYAWRFGRILSSVLVAAGEDREPLAVTGVLNRQEAGNLAIIYDQFIVLVDVVTLSEQNGGTTVTVHGFGAIDELQISTTHNYFDGTSQQMRHQGIELKIQIAGHEFVFPPTRWARGPLLQGDAALQAYTTIRDHRAGR
ncbi:hypothetical protein [Marisediminicola sp. LYQ134]|uniref:hypothetical protein n=1 Tax=Marisediminicola sp. LYQ134 TaxID=3391061 RepID=UPI003982F27D